MAHTSRDCAAHMQLIYIGVVYFLFKAGESMLDTVVRPYLLQAVCKKQNAQNNTLCLSLEQTAERLNDVQEEVSKYFFIYRLSANIPVVISVLYLGAWSDKHGRRLPMGFSCIGTVFAVLVYVGSMYVKDGTYKIWLVLSGSLFQGVFGKGTVFSMAVNCVIAEVSEEGNITKNTGIIFSMSFFGQCFGAFLAGILECNSLTSYLTVIGIEITTILIILFLVQENVHLKEISLEERSKERKGRAWKCNTKTESPERNEAVLSNLTNGKDVKLFKEVKRYLDMKAWVHCEESGEDPNQRPTCSHLCGGIKSYLNVVMRRRTHISKTLISVILFITFIHGCDISGVVDILFLFVTRYPFNWSNAKYSYFLSIENISIGFALVAVLPFLSKFLKLSDFTFIVIAVLCKICRFICTGFSNESWMLYMLVPIWGCSSFFICIRSVLCKCVEKDELGKLFSLYSSVDTISYLAGSVMYTSLYGVTVSIHPGITFFVMGLFNIIILIVFILMYKRFGKLERSDLAPVLVRDQSDIR